MMRMRLYIVGHFIRYGGPVFASWATVAACVKYLLS